MSFGFAVGDFVAVGRLAWEVCKAYKEAPENFQIIYADVLALRAGLKEIEESIQARPMTQIQLSRLVDVSQGPKAVLVHLQNLLTYYNRLRSNKGLSWDRLKWIKEDILQQRSRLTSHVTILNAYLAVLPSSVEKRLEILLDQYEHGHREPSVVSNATIDSLSRDDRLAWNDIRKELEGVGITLDAFNANKPLILDRLRNAIGTGILEEHVERSEDNVSQDTGASPNKNSERQVQSSINVSGKKRRGSPEAKEHVHSKGRSLSEADEFTSNKGRILPRSKRPAYTKERRSSKTERPAQEEERSPPKGEEASAKKGQSDNLKLFGQFLGSMLVEVAQLRKEKQRE